MKYAIPAIAMIMTTIGAADAAPRYIDKSAQATVKAMLKAHGGYDNWASAPSIRLEIAMYLAILPSAEGRTAKDNWRYYEVTVEPMTSNTLVNVPWENSDGYEVGLSKDTYWARPMTFDPTFQEPAPMLGWYHYGMINLPFLTQSDNTVLASGDDIEHPLSGKPLKTVTMTFDAAPGKSHEGEINLYINPETNLLAGWRLGTMYPELPGGVLPDTAPVPPGAPMRIVENYETYDGIVLPQAYTSLTPDASTAGTHVIMSASLSEPFPADALKAPDDATIVFQREK